MDEVTWTVTEQSGEVKKVGKVTQLQYRQPFEITGTTTKAMAVTIEGWNEMRQCLLDNGLMKSK